MGVSACDDDELERFRLVASGIAGQAMEVAAAKKGERSWSDGTTVFLELGASRQDQIRMLAVQASLVASGGLDPDILGQIARRPALARRYLAVEVHRALLTNESVVPPLVRSLINRELAGSITTASGALELARGRTTTDEPPRIFGEIRARQVLASIRRSAEAPLDRLPEARRARRQGTHRTRRR